jgi:hypothetical protein
MKTNNIIIAHPASKEELGDIKAFLGALNINFEEDDKIKYHQKLVVKVKKAQKSKNRTEIDPKDVWGSLGLH